MAHKQVKVRVCDRWRVVHDDKPHVKDDVLVVPENVARNGNAAGTSNGSAARPECWERGGRAGSKLSKQMRGHPVRHEVPEKSELKLSQDQHQARRADTKGRTGWPGERAGSPPDHPYRRAGAS